QRPGSPTAALELKTPNVDRTGPLPLRCETALDRVSSPPYWQMTPPTRLCRDAAGSLRSAKKNEPSHEHSHPRYRYGQTHVCCCAVVRSAAFLEGAVRQLSQRLPQTS